MRFDDVLHVTRPLFRDRRRRSALSVGKKASDFLLGLLWLIVRFGALRHYVTHRALASKGVA
jgi:hypothetical protein